MKSKFYNAVTLAGYLYSHALEERFTGPTSKNPGTNYITGTISIATNDDVTNIVDVHYSYITPTTSKGAPNNLYITLKSIIDGKTKTVMGDGQADAAMVSIRSSIALNEFYSNKNGSEELISSKRNEGGFITVVHQLPTTQDERNMFDVDMLITKTRHLDEDPERGFKAQTKIKGYIFDDFRKDMLPVEFTVVDPRACDYFEGADITEKTPMFTHLHGREISETVVKSFVEEGAFGEDSVREVKSSRKDFVIHWASKLPYDYGDEAALTDEDVKKMAEARNIKLATLKARLVTVTKPKATFTTSTDDFDF